jgi:hypothetical protein
MSKKKPSWRQRWAVNNLIHRLESLAERILDLMEPYEELASTWANRELDALSQNADGWVGPRPDRHAQVIQTVAAGHAFAALLNDLAQTQRELMEEASDGDQK